MTRPKPFVTSVDVRPGGGGGHEYVTIWIRGQNVGTLCVGTGDGEELRALLAATSEELREAFGEAVPTAPPVIIVTGFDFGSEPGVEAPAGADHRQSEEAPVPRHLRGATRMVNPFNEMERRYEWNATMCPPDLEPDAEVIRDLGMVGMSEDAVREKTATTLRTLHLQRRIHATLDADARAHELATIERAGRLGEVDR